jgi:hypothetical protein
LDLFGAAQSSDGPGKSGAKAARKSSPQLDLF